MNEKVYLVWKVPEEDEIDIGDFHDIGIYPTGELMSVEKSREDAERLINLLERGSPSGRFGENDDPVQNDMEDAPYQFTIGERSI